MTKEQEHKIKVQLIQIKNISTIMKAFFKPLDEQKRDFNLNDDEALERINNAYNFLKKYGSNYLDTAEQTIKEIVKENTTLIL